jgi:hypothetical protein
MSTKKGVQMSLIPAFQGHPCLPNVLAKMFNIVICVRGPAEMWAAVPGTPRHPPVMPLVICIGKSVEIWRQSL